MQLGIVYKPLRLLFVAGGHYVLRRATRGPILAQNARVLMQCLESKFSISISKSWHTVMWHVFCCNFFAI